MLPLFPKKVERNSIGCKERNSNQKILCSIMWNTMKIDEVGAIITLLKWSPEETATVEKMKKVSKMFSKLEA